MASAKLETAKFSALGILGYTGTLLGRELKYWQDIEDGTSGTGQIENLTPTDGNFIVGDGTAWVAESGATVRTSLGLGTTDSPTFAGVTSTGQITSTVSGFSNAFLLENDSAFAIKDAGGTARAVFGFSDATWATAGNNFWIRNATGGSIYFGVSSWKLSVDPATGNLVSMGSISSGGPMSLKSYTVATLPTASSYTGSLIYVSDETGGATVAYSNGTNWLRVYDAATVS